MNQTSQILAALREGRSLTPMDALHEFGCFRLAARIADLRSQGYLILTETESKDGKVWAKYRMVPCT